MEAIILLGLVGAGILKNKDKGNPINTIVNDDVTKINSDNVYSSNNFYKETDKQLIELAEKNFDDSFNKDTGVFNSKKIPRCRYGSFATYRRFCSNVNWLYCF